jgi:cytochrome c553
MSKTDILPLLEWERLIWSGRAGPLVSGSRQGERYIVTDFRVVVLSRSGRLRRELALQDVTGVRLTESLTQRIRGRSSIVLGSRRSSDDTLTLVDIRQGPQLALVLQLAMTESLRNELSEEFLSSALGKHARDPFGPNRGLVLALAVLVLIVGVLIRQSLPDAHPPAIASMTGDAAVQPLDRAAMMRLMEGDVMVFAKRTLGPLKGGPDHVTCATCHGKDGETRGWKMPAVRALPEPELRAAGLELYSSTVDAQIRNAIYGYLAEEDNQGKAAYMRGVVMPGMAKLLGRPAYDFTQSYDFNRSRGALGCYHCHEVTSDRSTPDH